MAQTQTLEAPLHTTEGDAGVIELRSPHVARFTASVRVGSVLSAGDVIGQLRVLNTDHAVKLPRGAATLRVTAIHHPTPASLVDYGAPLLTLAPAALGEGEVARVVTKAESLGLPEGAHPIEAPTDGQFYARPSPDDPPFINVGDVIKKGQVIGLVEVMKFFYEVPFEADGFEGGAKVVRIADVEGTAVEGGDVLVWVVGV